MKKVYFSILFLCQKSNDWSKSGLNKVKNGVELREKKQKNQKPHHTIIFFFLPRNAIGWHWSVLQKNCPWDPEEVEGPENQQSPA